MNLTDASRANTSGKTMEEELAMFLNTNDISYRRSKNNGIDFIIQTQNKTFYVDCKNQNVSGTADEKLPHTAWKYWKKYGYDEMYIIRGDFIPNKTVCEHLEIYPFKTHIVTMEEFIAIIKNEPIHRGLYQI